MVDYNKCPVCDVSLQTSYEHSFHVDCKRCGKFSLEIPPLGQGGEKNIFSELSKLTPKERANCSGLIRENQYDGKEEFLLTIDKIESFKRYRHPHIFEKADKLLLYFDKNAEYAGQWLDYSQNQDDLMGISWAIQSVASHPYAPYKELEYLLRDYLWKTKRFLSVRKEDEARSNSNPNSFWKLNEFCISPAGHEYIQILKQTSRDSNQGFCAMWFGGEKQSSKYDKLWDEAIKPAINEAGYNEKRIDKKDHVNDINDEMMMEIRRSKFMVCDFNEACCGVYFEAGFAKGLNLSVIWTCEKEELKRLHFDVDHYNFLSWEYEKLPDFRQALHRRIEAILGHGKNCPKSKPSTE